MSTLRTRLGRPEILIAPGVYDAFTARLVAAAGFEAAFLSGAGVSYAAIGQPDIGLVTQTEMAERVRGVAGAAAIPVLCDGDNGYGNAMNVMRTVRLFEASGAAAVQLEDQSFPKRCGHLAGKELISAEEMAGKIRAACAARASRDFLIVGRSDARSVLGLDEAIRRGRAYAEAGADVLFIEAPESRDELAAIGRALPGVPLMANMVEGSRTPLLAARELGELGFRIAIYPSSLIRRFARVGAELLAELRGAGTTGALLDQMVSFAELNRLVGLDELSELERKFIPAERR